MFCFQWRLKNLSCLFFLDIWGSLLHYTKTETVSIQPYISSKTNDAEMHNFSNTAPLEICWLSVIDLTQFITSGSNDWFTGVNEVDKLLIVSVACQYCLLELNQREFIEREKPTRAEISQTHVSPCCRCCYAGILHWSEW